MLPWLRSWGSNIALMGGAGAPADPIWRYPDTTQVAKAGGGFWMRF